MERLLGGIAKQVVLLTATPINNGLWDLYNLVMLFARHDRAFARSGSTRCATCSSPPAPTSATPRTSSPDVLYPARRRGQRSSRPRLHRARATRAPPSPTAPRCASRSRRLRTHRYDLDAAHPGLFESIADEIDALTMARYRPSAFDLAGEETAPRPSSPGCCKSGLLKRFESCWWACLETVERMLAAHDAFLAAWEQGEVLSRRGASRSGGAEDVDEAGLAGWVEERLERRRDAGR